LKVKPVSRASFPDDAKAQLGLTALTWLRKYDIIESEYKSFLWSDDREWLIFPFFDDADNMIAWSARNFSTSRPKPKYWHHGNISDLLHIVGKPHNETIVLTEDILSAIKVGRICEAMPVWGSNVPLKTLQRLSDRFKRVGVWLDMDKARESLRTARRAEQIGLEAKTIISIKDPKEYSADEINMRLHAVDLFPKEGNFDT